MRTTCSRHVPEACRRRSPARLCTNFLCAVLSYYYVVELGLHRFVHVSPGIAEVLGADPETLQIRDIVERVHPDDLPFFARYEEVAAEFFLRKITPEQRAQYKTSYTMRLRHNDGSYRLILHQVLSPLSWTASGA
ncbi:MAG: PAS domain-containing protein [Lewinellaceae bacterium]|nr:PAS domain-containing protein [Lewinellaceae bacterium]